MIRSHCRMAAHSSRCRDYATALPEAVRERTEWQTAAEMLVLAAKGERPVMFTEIAMRQALHAGRPALAAPPRRKAAKKYKIMR